jgi:hypothetical protein
MGKRGGRILQGRVYLSPLPFYYGPRLKGGWVRDSLRQKESLGLL